MPGAKKSPMDSAWWSHAAHDGWRAKSRSKVEMGGSVYKGPMDEVVEHLIKKSTGWSWRLR